MEGHLATCTGEFVTVVETAGLTGEFQKWQAGAGRARHKSHFRGRVQTEQLQRAEDQGIASQTSELLGMGKLLAPATISVA